MRELWIKIEPSLLENEKAKLIESTAALASAHIVEPIDIERARELGAKTVVSKSEAADIRLLTNLRDLAKAKKEGKRACVRLRVKTKGDERRLIAAARSSADFVIAECADWKIIPLENLIAETHGKSKLLTLVASSEEAKTALETLEIGVDGVVAELSDLNEITKIHEEISRLTPRLTEIEGTGTVILLPATITQTRPLGVGARVCIDTCDVMKEGEGLLVGCQSVGLFLIEAEVHETPFVAPRPFRVNAGSIALYVLAPDGKTRYLSELNAGEGVLIVDRQGRTRTTSVCRAKIEWRPLFLLEAECRGKKVKAILQNAETIRLVTEDGSRSVKDIKVGDTVLIHLEEGGRHFGTLVKDEKVIER